MVNILIGNTFLVRWKIVTNGKPESLKGRDIMPILLAPSGKPQKIKPRLEDDDTAIVFEYEGTQQKELGVYSIVAVENQGEQQQAITDEEMVFRLVATSEEATPGIGSYIEIPVIIDGKEVETVIPSGITTAITSSPMEITHNMDKFPVVIAVMKFGDVYEQVDVLVEYLSRNKVRVSWDIPDEVEGYIHII